MPIIQGHERHASRNVGPGKLSLASRGIDSTHHLSGTLFEQMYAAMAFIKGGRLRTLAINSKVRSPLLPNVTTLDEPCFPAAQAAVRPNRPQACETTD